MFRQEILPVSVSKRCIKSLNNRYGKTMTLTSNAALKKLQAQKKMMTPMTCKQKVTKSLFAASFSSKRKRNNVEKIESLDSSISSVEPNIWDF